MSWPEFPAVIGNQEFLIVMKNIIQNNNLQDYMYILRHNYVKIQSIWSFYGL